MRKKPLLVLAMICGILIIITILSTVQAQSNSPAQQPREWIVERGDTLWEIAAKNRGNTEIRRYIWEIQQLNDIGSTIHPGQVLLLPPGK